MRRPAYTAKVTAGLEFLLKQLRNTEMFDTGIFSSEEQENLYSALYYLELFVQWRKENP